jgi:uncharacterized protein (TIGR00106 family)
MNFAMFPTDKGSSVSEYVSKVIEMISKSGYNYKLTAMGTIIETKTINEATEILNKAYNILEPYSQRVYSTVTLDIQTNKPMGRLNSKIKSVEDKIGTVQK